MVARGIARPCVVLEEVALRVGGGDGLLHRDRPAVDRQGHVAVEVGRGDLVHADQVPVDVAGEQALFAVDCEIFRGGRYSWSGVTQDFEVGHRVLVARDRCL